MKYSYALLFPAVVASQGQFQNPDPTFDPITSNGDFGPFIPARLPAPGATGAPTSADAMTAKALQAACDAWSADTGMVSNFLNIGKTTSAGRQFNAAANVAFNAEVDELTHKGILDAVIGNDPQVSIANLTLTNGVFQSVVNNLQIMSVQGEDTQALIDQINAVRCVQILPSIDTYFAVAAQIIEPGATLRKAIRPAACAAIVAAAPASAFPNVPNVLGGAPLGQQAPASSGGLGTSSGSAGGNTATTKGGKGGNGATTGDAGATTGGSTGNGSTTGSSTDNGTLTGANTGHGATTEGSTDDGTTTGSNTGNGATTGGSTNDGTTTGANTGNGDTTGSSTDDGTTTGGGSGAVTDGQAGTGTTTTGATAATSSAAGRQGRKGGKGGKRAVSFRA